MDKKNIAIIGIGSLGRRHLEATMNVKQEANIYCIDANKEAEKICKMFSDTKDKKVFFSTNISDLPEKIEALIIATSSNVRRYVFEEAVKYSRIKYIIFEKVLFQKVEDYYAVKEILEANKIKAWVNCARREWLSYQELKKKIDKCNSFEVHIAGGEWGLACNGIHMLDLINYFDSEQVNVLNRLALSSDIVDSKRCGYKEIFGTLEGAGDRCKAFSISCYENCSMPLTIEIIGNKFKCRIIEGQRVIQYASAENEWKEQSDSFEIFYQSQLTDKVINNLFENGKCNLTEYNVSMQNHLMYIEPLLNYFEEKGLEKGICPIT